MRRFRRRRFGLQALTLPIFFMVLAANIAGAQGVPAAGGLDLAPTNPFGMPGTTAGASQGANSLYLNSGMFKDILPLKGNLEFGYLYQFNDNISTSRFTLDGVLPARAGHDGAAFGEFHGEFVNFGNTLRSLITSGITRTSHRGFNDRIDLSTGGGYRKIFGESLLVGVNGFYDASRLGNRWYGSPGVGVEMAALGAGHDLIDLNFNYYGNLFQGRNSIINAFRNGPGNFDLEVGYSLELGAYGPDLRLKLTGYQFDVASKVWGWNGGAEITSRNGMFSVKAEAGRDKINGTYYTLGGYANVGLQLENLLKGESPFTAPEPIFRSPRNLRRLLTQKVRRNWHQPSTIVVGRSEMHCGNTSRFIESLGTTSTTPFLFKTDIAPFVPVPYQCLRRGGRVSVTFTYNFGVTPTGSVAFSPVVADEAYFFGTLETELLSPPYSQTGTLTILFTTIPQSFFVDNKVNPGTFRLLAVAGPYPGQTLSISNILIQFNQ